MREPVEKAGGVDKVADILRQSSWLAVSDDGSNVKRVSEIKPVTDRESRSIYAKGFPDEANCSQVDLENFFSKFGKILAVRMRRDDKKSFKNSVFVEFDSVDDAKKFLALPQEERKYNDVDLLTMAKDAYIEMKCKEKGITPGSNNANKKANKGHFNAFKEERKGANGTKFANPDNDKPLTMTLMGKDIEVNKETGAFDESLLQFTPGAVLKWSAPSSIGEMAIRELKGSMKQQIEPSFVIIDDAKTGGMSGFKRNVDDNDITTLNDKVKVNDVAVSFSRPSADEEKQYYLENAKNLAQAVLNRSKDAGKKRKGGGQHHGNKKQRRN